MRVLLAADLKNWIFDRHCHEIKKRCLPEFDCEIMYRRPRHQSYKDKSFYDGFDVIYVLDKCSIHPPFGLRHKTIYGIRAEFYYKDKPRGPKGFFEDVVRKRSSLFHVVNQRQYNDFIHSRVDAV